jgi:TRAP-type uncharacterized transport system substrate-binding protein
MRQSLLSIRDLLASSLPFVLIGAALLWLAYRWLDPAPPRTVVLATGPEQGAYEAFGKRYAEELRRFGIEVELRATQGAAENQRLLRDRAERVDLAFLQGGGGDALFAVDEDRSGLPLVSLGSLFYEPVWIFYREAAARRIRPDGVLTDLAQLRQLRINVGAPGSGAANLVAKLLHANRIEMEALQVTRLAPTPAVMALLAGELDALVFVSAPESPLVQMLLLTPGVRLFEFVHAQAYARRFGFLSAQTLPRGVVDLAADVPPSDVQLVAATATLAAREGTHPALVQLFVQAATRVHGGTGWFARAGQFPSATDPDLPLAAEAQRYYRSGPPLLQRHLPFWLANLVDRMWVALVSIIAILIPLSRIVPPLYVMRIRSRVFRWYARLRQIEEEGAGAGRPRDALLEELDRLDARVEKVRVPLSHADELYALRGHIALVRRRLMGQGGAPAP